MEQPETRHNRPKLLSSILYPTHLDVFTAWEIPEKPNKNQFNKKPWFLCTFLCVKQRNKHLSDKLQENLDHAPFVSSACCDENWTIVCFWKSERAAINNIFMKSKCSRLWLLLPRISSHRKLLLLSTILLESASCFGWCGVNQSASYQMLLYKVFNKTIHAMILEYVYLDAVKLELPLTS